MRKILVALVLGLLSATVVCAQQRQTDRDFQGLKGPVKSVSVEKAMLKEQAGRQVEEPQRLMDEGATYDAEGNLVNDESYDEDGTLFVKKVYSQSGAVRVVDTYARYPTIHLPPNPSTGAPALTIGPPRQPKGSRSAPNLSEMEHKVDKYKYKYDDKGNISELTMERGGVVRRRVVYSLKAGGKEVLSYVDGKKLDYRRVETLDARGNVVESTATDVRDDDDGGDYIEKYSYTAYEFDARGNWVKRVKSAWESEEGKPRYVPLQVEYRTIVYF